MDKKDQAIVDKIRKKMVEAYSLEPEQELDNSINIPKEMIACQLLSEEIENQGGSNEDSLKVLCYMVVLVNMKRHRLDWEKAYEELGIDQLIEKYVDFEMKGNLKNEE